MSVWHGVIAGLVGGVIAAGAMTVVHKAFPVQPQQGDDATVKVADGITRRLLGRPIGEDTKRLAANVVHYAFGAGVGAVYGGLAEVVPRITMIAGVPFGLAVWLGAHVITVPALGLAEPPTRQPRSKEGLDLLLHVVYGAVAETVRRLVRRVL